MASTVERESRQQYKSRVWFRYRAGRITASKMKGVCHTDSTNPAQSLIKAICYPESFAFKSKQTDWGCTHEKTARDRYDRKMKGLHTGFEVRESGFVINCEWPFIGATGVVSCVCCGQGVLEIKCPFCHKGETIEVASQDRRFCVQKMLMGIPNWSTPIHTSIKYSLYVMPSTVTFVCVHSLGMKSKTSIKNASQKTLNSGTAAL